jgi:hypothetical protein
LWAFSFDREAKNLTVDPIRDQRLTFRNLDELEWFISRKADFYVDLPDAIDDIPVAP